MILSPQLLRKPPTRQRHGRTAASPSSEAVDFASASRESKMPNSSPLRAWPCQAQPTSVLGSRTHATSKSTMSSKDAPLPELHMLQRHHPDRPGARQPGPASTCRRVSPFLPTRSPRRCAVRTKKVSRAHKGSMNNVWHIPRGQTAPGSPALPGPC